jgi:archaemetzincin
VSSFRDNPLLTPDDGQHRWPASHCAAFATRDSHTRQMARTHSKTRSGRAHLQSWSPMRSAVHEAARHLQPLNGPGRRVEWLSRTAQTVTHELGHCFGIAHCSYFACAMQGCASTDESIRQPPYLCPICLEKVTWAVFRQAAGIHDTGESTEHDQRQVYVRSRYQALLDVCEKWAKLDPSNSMFVGYKAWLELCARR